MSTINPPTCTTRSAVFKDLIKKIRALDASSSSPIVFKGFDYSECESPLDKTSFTKNEQKNIIKNNVEIVQLTQKIQYLTQSLDFKPGCQVLVESDDALWSWPLTESGHLNITELKKMHTELDVKWRTTPRAHPASRRA